MTSERKTFKKEIVITSQHSHILNYCMVTNGPGSEIFPDPCVNFTMVLINPLKKILNTHFIRIKIYIISHIQYSSSLWFCLVTHSAYDHKK